MEANPDLLSQTWGVSRRDFPCPAVRDWLSGCLGWPAWTASSKVRSGEPGVHPGRWPAGAMSLLFVPQWCSVEAMGQ